MQDVSMDEVDIMTVAKPSYTTARKAIRKTVLTEPKKPRVPAKYTYVYTTPSHDIRWEPELHQA
jgi:hypothetical protein